MKNPKGKSKYPKPSPKPAVIKVVVHEPPQEFDGKGWERYHIVALDVRPKVLLVASHGQEIRLVTGQSNADELIMDGDSSKQSPAPNP